MRHTSPPSAAFPVRWLALALLVLWPASVGRAADPADRPEGKVLVLPFTAVNPQDSQAWLGKSVQQSLLADLTVVAPSRVTSSSTPAADLNAAVDAGKKADARYVVFGSFTTLDSAVRITGQLVDVQKGDPIGGLKATGSTRDIFRVEDALAMQVKQRL